MEPIKNNVFIIEDRVVTETKSGIVFEIDTRKHNRQNSGVVAAIDPNIENCELSVGDRVLISQMGGTYANVNNTEYLIIKYHSILGVLCGDDASTAVVGNRESDDRLLNQ